MIDLEPEQINLVTIVPFIKELCGFLEDLQQRVNDLEAQISMVEEATDDNFSHLSDEIIEASNTADTAQVLAEEAVNDISELKSDLQLLTNDVNDIILTGAESK